MTINKTQLQAFPDIKLDLLEYLEVHGNVTVPASTLVKFKNNGAQCDDSIILCFKAARQTSTATSATPSATSTPTVGTSTVSPISGKVFGAIFASCFFVIVIVMALLMYILNRRKQAKAKARMFDEDKRHSPQKSLWDFIYKPKHGDGKDMHISGPLFLRDSHSWSTLTFKTHPSPARKSTGNDSLISFHAVELLGDC